MQPTDLRNWLKWIDWLMPLPKKEDEELWSDTLERGKEKVMPYVPAFERIMNEQSAKMAAELAPKMAAELAAELAQVLAIEMVLESRFGAEGLALMPLVRANKDAAKRDKIIAALKVSSTTVEDVRQLLA